MTNATAEINHDEVHLRWVCGVVRSGYNNGARCRPSEPHGGWGCGARIEISVPDTPENRERFGVDVDEVAS